MSGTNPVFLVRKAKKSSGQKDAVLWCSDDFEAANATLDYLLIKSGAKLKDYFKAVATNFPVVNELPPEGELSLTFCDYYQLAKDNMTWTQIPSVTLPSSEAAAAARQHIVDGVDTETGEVLEDHNENFGNESNSPSPAKAPAPELTVVATMPLRHRVLAQHIGEGEYLYHVDASQKKEILRLEMDTDNSYVQNLILAAENVEPFKKAIEHDIHKAVNAYKQVFPVDGKVPELCTTIKFFKEWFSAEHINRGLLVKEWAERLKNKPAPVKKTGPHKVIVDDVNKPERPRRSEKPTHRTINYELACGFCEELDLNNLRPAMDFAKRIIAEDREDWKRMSMTTSKATTDRPLLTWYAKRQRPYITVILIFAGRGAKAFLPFMVFAIRTGTNMRLITPQQPMKKMRQGFVRRVNVCGILRQGDFSVMKKNHNRQANWQMNQQRLKQWNRTQLNI
ncbi:RecE family exodeoxyribonuclease, partial [Salmonella enterica subsp. enterica serovar Corvallis]